MGVGETLRFDQLSCPTARPSAANPPARISTTHRKICSQVLVPIAMAALSVSSLHDSADGKHEHGVRNATHHLQRLSSTSESSNTP